MGQEKKGQARSASLDKNGIVLYTSGEDYYE